MTLTKYGDLLICNAVVTGPQAAHEVILLVDTGSNHTVIPVEVAEKIGCSPTASRERIRITTADGVLLVPRVHVQTLTVLDQSLGGATVVAHDLPSSVPVDGLLGMDLLVALRARIDVVAGTIEVG